MRFLKTLSLNRRAIYDDRLAVDTANGVVMNTPNNLLMPKGATGDRPLSPLTGMIRYNTSTDEVEIYQGTGGSATWRSLRFKESTEIIQQTLGYGDASTTIFGPLIPAPPAIVENGKTWNGQNLLVVIENVIQLHTTNYVVVNNPTIPGQTYVATTTGTANVGSTTISFSTSISPIYPSVNIVGATITGSASIPASTTIISYVTTSSGQLSSVEISNTLTGFINAGTELTITDLVNAASGYYLQFSSPVPYSKPVTVLHGFDR